MCGQGLDHERRFQPSREAVQAFLESIHPWTELCVYDAQQPHAFTRTTYFDTEELEFLRLGGTGARSGCGCGSTRRRRIWLSRPC